MKYAFVNGQRQEAQSGIAGVCPACGSPMMAKCGNVRVHHWAHRTISDCDHWWESETAWHRKWKDRFPADWQEVVHRADNGELHIADVKTNQEWVLEFQHSHIRPEERKAREDFYQKLVWIVDGSRRKRDKSQLVKACQDGTLVVPKLNLWRIPLLDECAILRDWSGSHAPVFFDFASRDEPENTSLWYLIHTIDGVAYGGPFSRERFLEYHSPEVQAEDRDFVGLIRKINDIVDVIAQARTVVGSDPRADIMRRRERHLQARLQRQRRRF